MTIGEQNYIKKESSKCISISLDTANITGRIAEYTNHDMVVEIAYKGENIVLQQNLWVNLIFIIYWVQ